MGIGLKGCSVPFAMSMSIEAPWQFLTFDAPQASTFPLVSLTYAVCFSSVISSNTISPHQAVLSCPLQPQKQFLLTPQ